MAAGSKAAIHGGRVDGPQKFRVAVEDAQEMRKLAAWYRAFAALTGSAVERQRRIAHAEYLERKADELEKRAAADDPP
jgi:hypothetical protein